MYHTIEFAIETVIDLEISRKDRLELVLIKQGTRLKAQVRPHVVETEDGPVEVADLYFDDGTSTSHIRFELFSFVD